MNSASAKRIDIISDTHGYLSPALLDELEGADLIIHAGDLTSEMDYEHLSASPLCGPYWVTTITTATTDPM